MNDSHFFSTKMVSSFNPTTFLRIKESAVPKYLINEWKQLLFKIPFLVRTKDNTKLVELMEHFMCD